MLRSDASFLLDAFGTVEQQIPTTALMLIGDRQALPPHPAARGRVFRAGYICPSVTCPGTRGSRPRGIPRIAAPGASVGDRPIVALERIELHAPARLIERAFDLGAGVVLLLLTAPLFAVCVLAVRLDAPGGAFFRQRRIGVGGRAFPMWKFRTMGTTAERELDELRPMSDADGLPFKMKRDPRITRIGRVLRHEPRRAAAPAAELRTLLHLRQDVPADGFER